MFPSNDEHYQEPLWRFGDSGDTIQVSRAIYLTPCICGQHCCRQIVCFQVIWHSIDRHLLRFFRLTFDIPADGRSEYRVEKIQAGSDSLPLSVVDVLSRVASSHRVAVVAEHVVVVDCDWQKHVINVDDDEDASLSASRLTQSV